MNRSAVIMEGLKEVFWAPITWVPFVPAMGLVAFCQFPWWGNLAALGAPAAYVAANWAFAWPRVLKIVEGKQLLAQAEAEKTAFANLLVELNKQRLKREASILEAAHFIVAKMGQFNAAAATQQSLRIEEVARKVLEQMQAEAQEALKDTQGDAPRRARLEASLKTLQESQLMVERQAQLMERIATRRPEERLAELQDQLQNENAIAEGVLNRLESDTQKEP